MKTLKEINRTLDNTNKRKDGRYSYTLCIDDFTRKTFYGTTREKLKKKVADYFEAERQKEIERTNPTLSALSQSYLEELKNNNTPFNTYKNYKASFNVINNGIESIGLNGLGNIRIQDLTDRDMRHFLNQAKKCRSFSTLNRYRVCFSHLVNYAIDNDYLDAKDSPYYGIGLKKVHKERKEVTAPPQKEIDIVLDSVEKPFGLYAYMQYYTGMRRGELLALRYEDIGVPRQRKDGQNCFMVRHNLVFKNGNQVEIKPPKTKTSNRDIPIAKPLEKVLGDYSHKSGYIFHASNPDQPLTRLEFDRLWREYQKATGLTDLHTHQLRHAFTNQCIQNGMEIYDIQYLLGHDKISTTLDIYRDLTGQDYQRVQRSMDIVFPD